MSAQLDMSKRCYSERSKEIKDWKASYILGEGNWGIATLNSYLNFDGNSSSTSFLMPSS